MTFRVAYLMVKSMVQEWLHDHGHGPEHPSKDKEQTP
jgi:hypothetical protein